MTAAFARRYGAEHVVRVLQQPADDLVLMTSPRRFHVILKIDAPADVPHLTKDLLTELAADCPTDTTVRPLALIIVALRELFDLTREMRFGVFSPKPEQEGADNDA